MKLSAGVICIEMFDGVTHILLGHATNQEYWDLPKGGIDPGEKPIDAAVREFKEEFNVTCDPNILVDLGQMAYSSNKNLHLFVCSMPVDITKCVCNSTFEMYGRTIYEMDDFIWLPLTVQDITSYCSKSMAKLLISLISENEIVRGYL